MRLSRNTKNEKGASVQLHIVVPEEDKQQWIETAELMGITVSEYIRRSVRSSRLDFTIRPMVEMKGISEIAAQFGKIGSNINQIARHLNEGFGWSDSLLKKLQMCLDQMDETMQYLMNTVEAFNGDHQTYIK